MLLMTRGDLDEKQLETLQGGKQMTGGPKEHRTSAVALTLSRHRVVPEGVGLDTRSSSEGKEASVHETCLAKTFTNVRFT